MITGRTRLIVHLGYPTESFKAPMIYNPWFEAQGIEAVVVPVGVEPPQYPALLKALFGATNVHGALVTMPHKVTTAHLVDEILDCCAEHMLRDRRRHVEVHQGARHVQVEIGYD